MSIRLFAVSGFAVLFASAGCGQSDTGGTPGGATGGAAGSATDAGSDSATGGASGGATDAATGGASGGATDAATDGAADSATDGATDGGALVCVDITSDCNCLGSCPAACGALTECSSCSAFEMPAGIETYFKGLAAPLKEVVGTFSHCGPAQCSVVADFNGDGTDDFAGMYHYTVGDRGGGWELELVIIYSDGAGFKHVRYPYFGRIVNGVVGAYLVPQPPGVVQGNGQSATLQYPGIMAYRVSSSATSACYSNSTVHYWDGTQFARAFFSVP